MLLEELLHLLVRADLQDQRPGAVVEKGGGAAKSTVTVTKEMLRKIQREQRQKDKEEAEKLAKEEKLAASKKKRERKLSKMSKTYKQIKS